MKRLAILATLLVLALVPTTARAQVPQLLSYQGVLTDAGGVLVPDGAYNVTFRIFDVAVAGAPLFVEAHVGVPVVRGGFSVQIGSIAALTLPFDEPYWLEIQVAPDPPLTPRIRLASAPYALSLRLPFNGSATAASPAMSLRNLGAGPALLADGLLELGSGVENGEMNVRRIGTASPVLRAYSTGSGGNLDSRDEAGTLNWFVESDASGAGGFLAVTRSAIGTSGFVVDGNSGGTEEPLVTIAGDTRSIVFDTDAATGTASVALPTDAIQDTEIFDEPGVASVNNNANTILDGTIQTLLSRTITVPAAGFVVVTATSQLNLSHTTGTTSQVTAGISTVAGAFPATQDVSMGVPSGAASGFYFLPGATTAAFAVPAGATTFYYLAREDAGNCTVNDPTMTLTYSPTSYGVVSPPGPMEAQSPLDELAKAGPAMSVADVVQEQRDAETFHLARLRREMEAIKAQTAALKRQLEEAIHAQAQVATANAKPRK
jgi:hypothetical protein